MRRKVWVAVFGLLVLAVVAQSMVRVERRPPNADVEYRMGSNGRLVKVRNSTLWRYTADPSSFATVDFEAPPTPNELEKVRAALRKKDGLWTSTVESSRLPLPAARDDAMDQAITKIMHELRLSRVPSRDFVDNRMIVDRHEVPGPTVEGAETYVVKYDLKLTPDTWQLIAEDERNTRIRNRMGALGAFVAVATVLLGCVAGYIRIDDATKGYYSGRLKVLTVVVLVLAGCGIAAMID